MPERIYGRNPVIEALRANRRQLFALHLAQTTQHSPTIEEIVALAKERQVPVTEASQKEFAQLQGVNHQGVFLLASEYPYAGLNATLDRAQRDEEPPLLLLLDLLQDPQNLGSLLRTAEAAGVHATIIQDRRAVGVTPAVVRASAGAAEHMAVVQVTNLANTIRDLKENDIWVAGLEKTPDAQRYTSANLTGPLALVVGSEGRGLRRLVRERCDFLVSLPMRGQVTSLNAATAGAIALYEILRQREAQAG